MEDLKLKRRSIEVGHLEGWLCRGHGSFHFENIKLFSRLVESSLRLAGLLARGQRNALTPAVTRLTLEFPNLPEGFDGFRILHLSDIHADGLATLAENIADCVRPLEADLCVLTGDYRFEVYGPCHSVYYNMKTVIESINAPYGIIGILGNHDFAEESAELERMGVRMLINQAFELRVNSSSLWIVGLDDPHYYGCDDLSGALREVPREAFKILLVHTPELIKEAAAADVSLYLCGHTHGGQICLPFIGPLLTNANCPRKYTRGRWRYENVRGYTNVGAGSSGVPVRFHCPPEVAIIELRRG